MKTIRFLVALLFSVLGSSIIGYATGIAPVAVFGAVTAIQTVKIIAPSFQGFAFMAVEKEIWLDHLVGNLFKANPFMDKCLNADQFVLNGKVVHIPQAGAKIGAQRNRDTTGAAAVTLRGDTDITFALDEYTSDPIKIPNAETYELSYDKRESVIGESKDAISELCGDWMLRQWCPTLASNIVRTTGDAIAAHYGTGNRKAVTVKDVKNLRRIMSKAGVPKKDRYIQMDADMYDQFTDELSVTQNREFSKALNEKEGIVGRLFGFTFLDERADVAVYSNDATPVPKDPDAVSANDDNGAVLAWQKQSVIRALGTHEFFEDEGNPVHYGDIYSAILRAGGRIKREDQKGVYALVQAASA